MILRIPQPTTGGCWRYHVFRRLILDDTGNTAYFAASYGTILTIPRVSHPSTGGYWRYCVAASYYQILVILVILAVLYGQILAIPDILAISYEWILAMPSIRVRVILYGILVPCGIRGAPLQYLFERSCDEIKFYCGSPFNIVYLYFFNNMSKK